MATYRGTDGHVTKGGYLYGTPLVMGAVASAAATVTIDGTTLVGVLMVGDIFTVAGGANRTVTVGDVASTNAVTVQFTPAATVGFAKNATVAFTAQSLAQVTAWSVDTERAELDTTVMGATASSYDLDIVQWSGNATVLFDYDDTEQAALLDQALAGTSPTAIAVTFGVTNGRLLYGSALVTNASIQTQRGAIVTASLSLRGTGAPGVAWA